MEILLLTVLLGALFAIGFLCVASPTVRREVIKYFDLYSEIREEQNAKELHR